MPNYCENDLYITGAADDVAAVLAHIGADQTPPVFDFNTIIPYPDPFKAMDAEREAIAALSEAQQQAQDAYYAKWGTQSDGYNSGGYEWCCERWGTQGNAYDTALHNHDGDVIVTFQTAWSPPLPVIQALAERFPQCSFTLWWKEETYNEDVPRKPGTRTDEWETRSFRGERSE